MSIVYNQEEKFFNLHTQNTTYQMGINQYGYLLHNYYGRRIADVSMDQLLDLNDRGFSGNPHQAGRDRNSSLDKAELKYTG